MTNLQEIKKIIDELEGRTGGDYKNFIVGLICFEKDIEPSAENLQTLGAIYDKYMSCDYTLLHDVFYDNEYDLFNDEEKELLGL